ncbi:hypothetical protein [Myceligenerans xiligouense]|uniref:Uncharacterized protein n=1 Tax=Myceligenerans xiligouense TaxID=253184 RepID=A0A3N4ZLV9_9MICO|nr:hypothetical protein [Myceligenerans xiligouense]RPF20911.1 hypothetical protein EDD34_1518 [Myceligenerans xiligouense]
MEPETIRRSLDAIDEAGERYLRALCQENDVTVERVGVRTPDAMLLVALIGAAATVSFVVERWHDRLRGGQVIDLRPEAERVAYRDPGLAYGYVVVRAVDGTVTVHVHELPSQTLEIVKVVVDALTGMTGKGAHEIARMARESVDGRASVEVDGQ